MDFDIDIVNYWVLIPAVSIILFLAFLEKRQSRRDCCNGRPGLPIPYKFLDGYEHRTAYAMAFGTTMSIIISIVRSERTLGFDINLALWAWVFYVYLQAFRGCLICYPVFACLTTQYKAVGAILCFLYSVLWVVLGTINTYVKASDLQNSNLYGNISSTNETFTKNFHIAYEVMKGLPVILCYLVLACYVIYILYRCYIKKTYFNKQVKSIVKLHQKEHVRWVFRKFHLTQTSQPSLPSRAINNTSHKKFIDQMADNFNLRWFTNVSFFKYPTRVVVVAFLQLLVMYWLGLFLIFGVAAPILLLLSNVGLKAILSMEFEVLSYIDVLVSVAVTIFIGIWQIFIGMRNYRYHMLRIYQGDLSFMPKKKRSPQYILARGMAFSGYQVAVMMWGTVISFLFVLVVLSILIFGIYYLSYKDKLGTFALYIAQLLCFPLVVILVFYLQVYLAKAALLQDKIHETDKNPPLNIDNRRVYEVINYFALFANMTVGIFTCFFRIARSICYGVAFSGRLDRSIFTRDLESMDKGFTAYTCMLLVDNAHNNPTMRVFAHLLWTKVLASRMKNFEDGQSLDDTTALELKSQSKCRSSNSTSRPVESPVYFVGTPGQYNNASKRWFLAYTLLKNPELAKYRKHKLRSRSVESGEGNRQLTDSSENRDVELSDVVVRTQENSL